MAIRRASCCRHSMNRCLRASLLASCALCSPRTLSMVLRPRNFSSRVGVAASSSGGASAGGSMLCCTAMRSVQHPVGYPRRRLRCPRCRGSQSDAVRIAGGAWARLCLCSLLFCGAWRWEGQPSAVRAAATFLWRSGVPRSALYVVRLKIRPFQNPVGISGSMVFGDPGDV